MRANRRFFLQVLLTGAVGASACSPPELSANEQACEAYFDAVRGAPPSGASTLVAVPPFVASVSIAKLQKESFRRYCASWMNVAYASGVTATWLEGCAQAIRATGQIDALACRAPPTDADAEGTEARCRSDSECALGFSCQGQYGACGWCRKIPEVGEPCQDIFPRGGTPLSCVSGAHCTGTWGGVCAVGPGHAQGEACSDDASCSRGLVCANFLCSPPCRVTLDCDRCRFRKL